MPIGRRSGFKPSSADHPFGRSAELYSPAPSAPIRPDACLPPPFAARDQKKQVPCCVSCAIVQAMEALDAVHGSAIELSPMFNYFMARPGQTGRPWLRISEGLSSASSVGIASESRYRSVYKAAALSVIPSYGAKRDALQRRLVRKHEYTGEDGFWQLDQPDRLREWKACLNEGWPIVAAVKMSDAYRAFVGLSDELDAEPVLPPGLDSWDAEGHAVAVLGYDDRVSGTGAFLICDSRGTGFGYHGRWMLPYELLSTSLVMEAWALRFMTYGVDD